MSEPKIAIVDYQAGNLRSVQKALERYGSRAYVSSVAKEIEMADGLVFPGQGSNDSSMRALAARGLVDPIKKFISSGKPFFGICLGLQLLLERSDEGLELGFGVIAGEVRRLPSNIKVPHMGWNQVKFQGEHPIFDSVPNNSNFYFVHSYYADPEVESLVAGTTTYGLEFCSAVAWDNVVAVQFHPEKSGANGLKLYERFVEVTKENR